MTRTPVFPEAALVGPVPAPRPVSRAFGECVLRAVLSGEEGTAEALILAAAELAPDQEGRLPSCYVHPAAVPSGRLTRCVLGPGAAPPPALTDDGALWFEEHGNQVRLGL